jgi:hypothetical protein
LGGDSVYVLRLSVTATAEPCDKLKLKNNSINAQHSKQNKKYPQFKKHL